MKIIGTVIVMMAMMTAMETRAEDRMEERDTKETMRQQIMVSQMDGEDKDDKEEDKKEAKEERVMQSDGYVAEKTTEEEEEQQQQEKEKDEELKEEEKKEEYQQKEEVEENEAGNDGGSGDDGFLMATSKEGRLHYDLLLREAQAPSHGSCYQAALEDLGKGCSKLDDKVQSRLALAFTNCYLVRFGWPTYPCAPNEPLSICMGHLDTRAASLYSSLLTSTLAMCHYLEAQTWRKSTARAVYSLKETSYQVSSQLDIALASAASLRMEMDKQLTESRDALTSAFKDIRESAEEQRSLVEGVFLRVGQLHSLVMGEFSGINAVAFYVVGVIVSILVTCGPRTGGVRIPLLLLLTVALAVERLTASFILTFWDSYSPQEDIQSVAQVVRRLAATFGTLLVVHSALCFRDPLAAALARLEELTQATQELKKLFGIGGGANQELEQTIAGSLMEVFEHSDSSDDSYDPNDDSDLEEYLAMLKHPPPMCTTRKIYPLRPRKPFSPNPVLANESPTAFSLLLDRPRSLSRRIALCTRSPADPKLQQKLDQEEEAGVVQ